MKRAMMFPGQGSQSVGMLAALAAAEPAVAETFGEASDALGYDLWALCQQGPEERLSETERTQPAMLSAGIATWRAWERQGGPRPDMLAGHSLGEYSALVASGALDFRATTALVRFRGEAMQRSTGPLLTPSNTAARNSKYASSRHTDTTSDNTARQGLIFQLVH